MLHKNKPTRGQRGGSVVKGDYSEIISSFKREETVHLLLVSTYTSTVKHIDTDTQADNPSCNT